MNYFIVNQDGVANIIRQEGPTSLWRGLSPALVMSVPGNIIYFVGYDYLRNAIKDWTVYKQKDYAPLLAGGAARGKFHQLALYLS
jgi:solute carrier family 25, member 39/40